MGLCVFVQLFCSPVLTFAYAGLVLIAFGFVLKAAYPNMATGVPDDLLTSAHLEPLARMLACGVNEVFLGLKKLFFWSDFSMTVRALFALYGLKLLAYVVSAETLVILVLEGAFIVPLSGR